ncbi:hypothetical protein JCM8097_008732 [Rhodosporidiobolus ruineniae]
MSSQDRLAPSPAACLSEEAMDLICSFVREFEDDREMASTLCALSLTSRRWTSSAVRALYFDPTRSLSRTNPVHACWLLSAKLLKRPGLGSYACDLRRLVDKHAYFEADQAQLETWVVALFRSCTRLVSVTLPVGGVYTWASELQQLVHLRHVALEPACAEDQSMFLEELEAFLPQLCGLNLSSLTFTDLYEDWEPFQPSQYTEIRVDSLEVAQYDFSLSCELPIRPLQLKSLCLRPVGLPTHPGEHLLQPSLQRLEYQPSDTRFSPPQTVGDANSYLRLRSSFPYGILPALPNLRHLSLEYIFLDLQFFADIAQACPLLEYLSLKDSTWCPDEWEEPFDPFSDLVSTFRSALNAMPFLQTLDAGWMPVYNYGALYAIQAACDRRRINLICKPSLVRSPNPRVEEPAHDAFRSEASIAYDEPHPKVVPVTHDLRDSPASASDLPDPDFPFPSSFTRFDGPLVPPPFLPPTGVPSPLSSSPDRGDDSDFFEPSERLYLVPSPASALPAPNSNSLFSAAFPFFPLSPSPSLPPSRSPSPVFLPASPDEPRFEPDYQALDLGEKSQDDFDSGDGEAWRRWEGLAEVDEANRAWKEGEGTTYEPIDEPSMGEDKVEVEQRDELDEAAVEATIEVGRAVEVCAA